MPENPLTQISIIRLDGPLAAFYNSSNGEFKITLYSPQKTIEIITGPADATLEKLSALLLCWPNITVTDRLPQRGEK